MSDVKKVLVLDDRLNCSSEMTYAVVKGAQSMNPASFQAVSASTSSHVYNIQTPSEQTIIDRRVLWRSTITLAITGTAPAGQYLINYGLTDALSAFPLHQLANVMSVVINNNSVSLQVRDVLPALLRFNDRRELTRYNGYTPTAFDTYFSYADGVGANNNVLGAWGNTSDNDLTNRGSWVLESVIDVATGNAPLPSTGAAQTLNVRFTVSEPLLISPFISCKPVSNNQGFYGIQNMTMTFSMGDASRVWRTASPFAKAVSVVGYSNSQLLFNFLTAHSSLMLPSKNVVPYQEFPRYITSFNGAAIASGASYSARSSTIQLNTIPDKLIMFVRKVIGEQTSADSDCVLALSGDNPVSIQFNNVSGLLSSATQQDLYRYATECGYNGSWFEFSGNANMYNSATGIGRVVPTSGAFVVLEFGTHIPLNEEYYAAGSLGSFSLQVNMNVRNQGAATLTNAELVIITMNSGAFVCERGASSTFTSLLTKADVLEASAQQPYFQSDAQRLVGGSFLDSLRSIIGRVLPILAPMGKEYLSRQGALGDAASKVIGALGYGQSGGKMSKLHERMMK